MDTRRQIEKLNINASKRLWQQSLFWAFIGVLPDIDSVLGVLCMI